MVWIKLKEDGIKELHLTDFDIYKGQTKQVKKDKLFEIITPQAYNRYFDEVNKPKTEVK